MTEPAITGIAPFFIVRNVPAALAFYRDRLGFEITFKGPSDDDIFFRIVVCGDLKSRTPTAICCTSAAFVRELRGK